MTRSLLLSALLLLGCGPESAPPLPGSSALTVTARFERDPVTRTNNVLLIRAVDANGNPVTGAWVGVSLEMPAHGHVHSEEGGFASVTDLGGGDYRAAPLSFTMAGKWQITSSVERNALRGDLVLTVTAP